MRRGVVSFLLSGDVLEGPSCFVFFGGGGGVK